jgi:hypothetical protein
MDDPIYGRAEYVFFSPAITKSMFQSQVFKWYPLFSTAVNNHAVDNYCRVTIRVVSGINGVDFNPNQSPISIKGLPSNNRHTVGSSIP